MTKEQIQQYFVLNEQKKFAAGVLLKDEFIDFFNKPALIVDIYDNPKFKMSVHLDLVDPFGTNETLSVRVNRFDFFKKYTPTPFFQFVSENGLFYEDGTPYGKDKICKESYIHHLETRLTLGVNR